MLRSERTHGRNCCSAKKVDLRFYDFFFFFFFYCEGLIQIIPNENGLGVVRKIKDAVG
jgi:hypothetical protein